MTRVPTLGPIIESGRRTARRFPLVLASSWLAAYAGIRQIGGDFDDSNLVRLILVAMLGLPLFFALTLFAERRRLTWDRSALLQGGGVLILGALWWRWPGWSTAVQFARYVQLSVGFHLLVAVLPYAGLREHNGFWHYNRILFLRFLLSALYSGVLFSGLAIALLAIDKLFGVKIPEEAYARLWVLMAYVFNTWFFVAGAPEDLDALEARTDYPRGLSVFTQYVLLPIVVIYLVILTLYLGKVVATREWPSGWIGYLVSSVAVVGILSWLLVRPLEDQAEHRWVKGFTRGFYFAMMPAVVMLWLAIWQRVGQYGVTERRYFLIVLSLWLAGITVYYTFRRSRNITVIPASLCAIALLTFAGPWGAFSVSRASQTRRLRTLLERTGALAGGAVRASAVPVSFEDRKQLSAVLDYLLETHGSSSFSHWFADPATRAIAVRSERPRRRGAADAPLIMKNLGMTYVRSWERRESGRYFSYYTSYYDEPVSISGYEYAVRLETRSLGDSVHVNGNTWLRYDSIGRLIRVTTGGKPVLDVPIDTAIARARATRSGAGSTGHNSFIRLEAHQGRAGALVLIRSLTGTIRRDSAVVGSVGGDVYVRLP